MIAPSGLRRPFRAPTIPATILAALLLAGAAGAARSAEGPPGRVELELVGDARGAALEFHQWVEAIRAAGIENVRLRTSQTPVEPEIQSRGDAGQRVYTVVGVVSGDVLILPDGRYRRAELRRLAQRLDELARLGPPDQRATPGAFGLSAKQTELLLADAAKPVAFSTAGLPRRQAVDKLAGALGFPVRFDPGADEALAQDGDVVAEELLGVSRATALACLLRPAGLCLVPRDAGGASVVYAVVRAAPGLEIWPIGWEPKKPAREYLPGLFEIKDVNVQGVSVADVLSAVGKQLAVPVLFDHNALARHGIDAAKAPAAHPPGRTTYSSALRKMLFSAGLKFEVRLDEAEKPLLWVTTLKAM